MAVSAMHSVSTGLDNLTPHPPPPRIVSSGHPPHPRTTSRRGRLPSAGNTGVVVQPVHSSPNLLYRSMLKRAASRGVVEQGDRRRFTYSSSGHRCWSSLRIREWQEFQRMLNEENDDVDDKVRASTTSYMYFSTPRASRMSKKSIRKQLGSPDSDYYNRERSKDFRKIEDALDTVNFVKNQKRQDFLSGVPNEYFAKAQMQQSMKEGEYDKEGQSRSPTKPPVSPMKSEHDNPQSRITSSRPQIPGLYVFPKQSSFVPPDGTKLETVGVDWKYTPCHKERARSSIIKSRSGRDKAERSHSAIHTSSTSSIPGTLLRSVRPVTEGLMREGTSVSKIQGKPLGPGEWPVEKVWKRKLDGRTNTLQMARYDITSDQLKDNLSDQEEVEVSKKDSNDDTMSMEAQSIDRADTEQDNISEKSDI